ncbi:unnamed protein product, partial [Ixodes hexagonus]
FFFPSDTSLHEVSLLSPYDPSRRLTSPDDQQSTLKSWVHVWDEEPGESAALRPKLDSVTTAGIGVLSMDTWRPPLMIGPPATPSKPISETEDHASEMDTFIVAFTFCLGVSGFWKMPVLVTRHGGAFFVACLVMYALLAQPVLYLELILGQFTTSGVTRLYRCFPLFKGVGYMSVMYCFLLAVCQSLREVYAAFYLIHGTGQGMPWSRCRDEWTNCYNPDEDFRLCKDVQGNENATAASDQGHNATSDQSGSHYLANPSVATVSFPAWCVNASRSSSEAYLVDFVWELSEGVHEIGSLKRELLALLTVLWVVLFLICSLSPTSVRVVRKVLALLAALTFVPFFVECIWKHWCLRALRYSFMPDIYKLVDLQVWMDAAEHTMLSLGTCCGLFVLMGSHCKYGTSMERCIISTVAADIIVSQMISVLTYSWIFESRLNQPEISPSVPLFFHQLVTIPQLVLTCKYPKLCCVIIFTALVTAGLSAQASLVQTCVVEVCRAFNFVGNDATMRVLLGVCCLAYCVSIFFCTQAGPHFHVMIEQGLTRNLMFVVALVETLALIWLYGVRRISFDVEYMLRKPASFYWLVTWTFTAPTIALVSCPL